MRSRASVTSTSEARTISTRWPSSPKPVTSVAAWTPCRRRMSAAVPFDCTMWAIAAITQRALALPRMSAASSVPVPIGLVRMSASPGRSPPLRNAAARETSPLTAKPSASSAPSLVWPPTSAQPASRSTSLAPAIIADEVGLDLGFEAVGHGGDRQRRLRLAAHGIDVAERVVGGDLAEQVGVVDDGAEIVDGLQRELVAAGVDERRVVRRVEADDHVVARRPARSSASARDSTVAPTLAPQPPQRMAMAEISLSACWSASGETDAGGRRHLRQLVELAHEAPVDPVLPAPHPRALERPAVAGAERIALAGRDEIERVALRPKRPQRLPGEQCGEYCRPAPARRAPHRRPTSAARAAQNAMVSPAANTSSRPGDAQRRVDLEKAVARRAASPVLASQRAGAACVVQRISSASTGARPSSTQPSGARRA